MSVPHKSGTIPKKYAIILRLMLALAVIASVFVIVQSCSVTKKPSLVRFAKGSLKKMVVLETPPPMPSMTFKNANGKDVSLVDFRGKAVLLNVWATWCAPCVAEIPSLDALQAEHGGDSFVVIAVSMDRHIDDAASFYKKTGIENLGLYIDPTLSISTKVGVQGLPISIFYAPNGREIARIPGEVDWQSPQVTALLDAILP
ncbi:MAG: TlpA family protein disulfide reductase [Robiginitomaculum sp.]|nr:TlpA family protein disulfide reductase [Robiginitomaculum sp.]